MNLQELITDVLEYLRGMWRFRWWAAAISWVVVLAGCAYVYSLPPVYQASAKVFVDTNSLLRPLMEGLTAQQNPLDEVQVVSRSVLTRPNLEAVANETDLTLRASSPEQVENIVSSLQSDIEISGGRENVFTIRYTHMDRRKSVEVVSAVVDNFIENSIGNQGTDSQVTEQALAGEIEAHEKRLREAEQALAEFKKENIGYMPGEAGDYYERLQSALDAVAATQEEIKLLTERRNELQRQIEGEEPVFGIMGPGGGAGNCSQSGQIAELESQLATLRVNYTDKHPRIERLEQTIAQLEERCASEGAASGGASAAASSGSALEANPVYQNLRIQLSETEVELASLRAELKAQQETVEQLRRDVDKIADVETQLTQLNRDYNVVQRRHQELLSRWEDLQATQRLDPVTDQVRFRRIEPPFAPTDPVGPNRTLLLGGALLAALGAGGGVAFGLSQLFPVFFTRRSLGRAVGLPVIGTVSMVMKPGAIGKRRVATLAWIFSYAVLVAATAVAIVFASPGSALFRSLAAI